MEVVTMVERYLELEGRLPEFDATEYEGQTIEEVIEAMGDELGLRRPLALNLGFTLDELLEREGLTSG